MYGDRWFSFENSLKSPTFVVIDLWRKKLNAYLKENTDSYTTKQIKRIQQFIESQRKQPMTDRFKTSIRKKLIRPSLCYSHTEEDIFNMKVHQHVILTCDIVELFYKINQSLGEQLQYCLDSQYITTRLSPYILQILFDKGNINPEPLKKVISDPNPTLQNAHPLCRIVASLETTTDRYTTDYYMHVAHKYAERYKKMVSGFYRSSRTQYIKDIAYIIFSCSYEKLTSTSDSISYCDPHTGRELRKNSYLRSHDVSDKTHDHFHLMHFNMADLLHIPSQMSLISMNGFTPHWPLYYLKKKCPSLKANVFSAIIAVNKYYLGNLSKHDLLNDKLNTIYEKFKLYFCGYIEQSANNRQLVKNSRHYQMLSHSIIDQKVFMAMQVCGYDNSLILKICDCICILVAIHYTNVVIREADTKIATPPKFSNLQEKYDKWLENIQSSQQIQHHVQKIKQGVLQAARQYMLCLDCDINWLRKSDRLIDKFKQKFCGIPGIEPDIFAIKETPSEGYAIIKLKKDVQKRDYQDFEECGLGDLIGADKSKHPGIVFDNRQITRLISAHSQYLATTQLPEKSWHKISFISKNIASLNTPLNWEKKVINPILLQCLKNMDFGSRAIKAIKNNPTLKNSCGTFYEDNTNTARYGTWPKKTPRAEWQSNGYLWPVDKSNNNHGKHKKSYSEEKKAET